MMGELVLSKMKGRKKKRSVHYAFDTHYSNNPCGLFQHSIWIAQIYRDKKPMISIYCRNSETFDSRSDLLFPIFRDLPDIILSLRP